MIWLKIRETILITTVLLLLNGCQTMSNSDHMPDVRHGNTHGQKVGRGLVSAIAEYRPPQVLELSAIQSLHEILPKLTAKRVVYVGETHDRLDHHQNQLEIIRGFHQRNPDMAIGMESFQQPFQAHLDDYVEGRIDDKSLLRRTEYYDRWRFDYRLYQPILKYARDNRIPVVALNIAREITKKVGDGGFGALTEEERAQVPQEIDRSDTEYIERLRKVYAFHARENVTQFDRFLDVQLLWDEGMAERVARYLKEHLERKMVVLAGSGHLSFGAGIPKRVTRRLDIDTAIVLSLQKQEVEPDMADFLLLTKERHLSPAGRLGVFIETGPDGVKAGSFAAGSAGLAAGMEEGDQFLSLNGERVKNFGDIKIALWDKQPGEKVTVRVRRGHWWSGDREIEFKVTLR
ncbi:MAG: PDZ domain-containing protein [Gammaproteobacteria bacterium]|nr:PDZ domain-containing protein [Gammaproteobacteria bacterium]